MSLQPPKIGPVEVGNPVPRGRLSMRKNTAMGAVRAAISEMQPGESRQMSYPTGVCASRFSQFIHRAAELEKLRVVTRKTDQATVRVWRTA